MDNKTKNNEKDIFCIRQLRRGFLLVFLLMIVAIVVMYGSTEDIGLSRYISMTTYLNLTIASDLKKLSNNLTYRTTDKVKYRETSTLNLIKHGGSEETNATVDLGGTHKTTLSLEYPGMPDPCARPRRNTGVEDILCMKRPNYLKNFKNPCWKDDKNLKCTAYFYLFGICKSGTSDFSKRLYLHPDIVPNKGIFGKEIWYWSVKRLQPKSIGGLLNQGMTFDEFSRHFQAQLINGKTTGSDNHPLITGHGDPMDVWSEFLWKHIPQNDPKAAEPTWTTPYFVHHMNPNVKLLLLLRDPVERLFSSYLFSGGGSTAQEFHRDVESSILKWKECTSNYSQRQCVYSPDLKDSVKAPIYTSFYDIHVEEWLKVFPREQLFIFRHEDYINDIKGTLGKVFRFLEIDIPANSTLHAMENLPKFYATKKKLTAGKLQENTIALLVQLYRPHMEKLATLLQDDRFLWNHGSF